MIKKTYIKINITFFKRLLVIFGLITSFYLSASHIVGGEISYFKLPNGTYKITLKVYRDCSGNLVHLDNPAYITVFNSSNTLVASGYVALTSSSFLPPTYEGPCVGVAPGNMCVQEGIYEFYVNLPPAIGGYIVSYQRCCRNATILNLNSPESKGATYSVRIPGTELVENNSGPTFNKTPPMYVCKSIPLALNFSATDPDGDTLVYSLDEPIDGATQSLPAVHLPPPFVSIPYNSIYTASYPMSSNPTININPNTGFLNGSPDILGQWVVAVKVSEFRNGVQIGTHRREFQFNVVNCGDLIKANIISPIVNGVNPNNYCGSANVQFTNNSGPNPQNLNYLWNFGDTSTLSDTTNIFHGAYTYSTPGVYTITLIAKSATCRDTAQTIYKYMLPTIQVNSPSVCLGQVAQLTSTVSHGLGTYEWLNNASTSYSMQTGNLFNMTNYKVTYSLEGCPVVSADANVAVNHMTLTTSSNVYSVCINNTLNLASITNSLGGIYKWTSTTDESFVLSNNPNVVINPTVNTTYTLNYEFMGCKQTSSLLIQVNQMTINTIPLSQTVCISNSVLISSTTNSLGGIYNWSSSNPLSNINNSTVIDTPSNATTYSVNYEYLGCIKSSTATITVNQMTIAATPPYICISQTANLTALTNSVGGIYTWLPNNENSNIVIVNPTVATTYTLKYEYLGCTKYFESIVKVNQMTVGIVASTPSICLTNSANLSAITNSLGGTYTWMPSNSFNHNIIVSPTIQTVYMLNYQVQDCIKSVTQAIAVNQMTLSVLPNFSICLNNQTNLGVSTNSVGGTYTILPIGQVTNNILLSPKIPTNYTLMYNYLGCTNTKTINVSVNQMTIGITPSQSICSNEIATLEGNTSFIGGTYNWFHSNETNQSVTVSPQSQKIYTLSYTYSGCSRTITSIVSVNQTNILLPSESLTLCVKTSTIITPITNSIGGTYQWLPQNITTNTIVLSPSVSSTFTLNYTYLGCTVKTTLTININSQNLNFSQNDLINVFTPNNDGINDDVTFNKLSYCEDYGIVVFDKWGNKVFDSPSIQTKTWKGLDNFGNKLDEGVYFYILQNTFRKLSSSVHLFR